MSTALKTFFVAALLFRIGTLVVSIRHKKQLKHDGATEYGATNSMVLAFSHLLIYVFAAFEGALRRSSLDLLGCLGLLLYVISGISLLVVMRLLGRLWTVKLLIASDHALIDNALFRLVRHPNYYLNILPELVGLTLALHSFVTLAVGVPLYLIPLSIRIREEEKVMRARFQNYS